MIKIQEKDNILRVFQESKEALEKEDVVKLKDLSNQTIHSASFGLSISLERCGVHGPNIAVCSNL